MNRNQSGRRLAALAACVGIAFSAVVLAAPAKYPTAEEAATALVTAVQKNEPGAIEKVLGVEWKTFIPTETIDPEDVDAFLASYKEGHKMVGDATTQHLEVGKAGWTLPMPIVKGAGGWAFDLKASRAEMLTRTVGRNELDTQQAILAFYDAEREYAEQDHNGDGVLEYAQKFFSTPGKTDGLYWEAKDGAPESPLGPSFVDNAAPKGGGGGYHGYHYRILTAQGPSAPGGAYNYVVGGRMRNGFAAIAWPSRYGETGVMSFMVSHDGVMFEKDLGKNGGVVAGAMKTFDPDSSWTEDDDPSK